MRTDWNEALDAWAATERERLGGPPSPEEVVSLLRGELSQAEAERVRALLVYYPELTPLLDERIERRSRLLPIAAGVVLALLGALIGRLSVSTAPYAFQTRHELHAVQSRGTNAPQSPIELPDDEATYLLAPILSQPPHHPAYRIAIVDASASTVWRSGLLQPANGTFDVSVPRKTLRGGTYELRVYGVDDEGSHLVDRYGLRVTPQNRGRGIF